MAFGLDLRFSALPGVEDDLRTQLASLRADAAAWSDRLHPVLDGSAFAEAWQRSGLPGLDGGLDVRNLSDLAALAERLPYGLGRPDATGEVPTGSAAVGREEAAVLASLAAVPRVVEALGPDSAVVQVQGVTFAVGSRYEDPVSGFSAVRLDPLAGDGAVFAVDGLEVGSRADEVAAATLGRLQVESPAFAAMIVDATAAGLLDDAPVRFAGASLGGAVAQVAAYEAAQALLAAGQSGADEVQLVTVDPLGGRDAAEAVNGGALDPAALGLIEALNLRTEGDIVSRIGSHIGATLTLPGLDAQGNEVQLSAADAHVNVVSLLQTLSSDALFAQGVPGAPAEISGFARASDLAADQLISAWLASGRQDDATPGELQIPGTASFDPTGTVWSLDADSNGTVDIAVTLSAPVDQLRADLVIG